MPVYEPGGRIAIVLDCDSAKPSPPTFIVSALSARESLALKATLDGLMDLESHTDQYTRLEEVLRNHVQDWRNFPLSFDTERLLDVLGTSDMWRLAYSIARQIGTAEKKPEAGSTN
jgi:hypothetical protein